MLSSLPVSEVISGYIDGKSCNALAKQFNCGAMAIHGLLVRHNVPRRNKWDHNTLSVSSSDLSELHRQIIEGCLLGDGSVLCSRITSYFSLTSIYNSFARHIVEMLPLKFRIQERKARKRIIHGTEYNSKTSYNIVSVCDKSLNEFRKNWYNGRNKIVPSDLSLSPATVKYWFYGDGSTSFMPYNSIQLSFSTNGFTVGECEMLTSKLYDACGTKFGVYLSRGQPMVKTTKKQGVNNFFDYIGECTAPCFKYKWKLPGSKPI